MGGKKYVPSGCQLLCDKGAVPTPLTVTSNKSKIYGDCVATEADLKPGENIKPFGACSIKNGAPCSFAPVYWDKCINGVKINGKKLIIQDAKLLCSQGGQISIFFSKADAMAAAGGALNGVINTTLADIAPYFDNIAATDKMLPMEQLRWSQTTASNTFGNGKPVSGLRDVIVRTGGNSQGIMPPLEVVRMEDGSFTSLDHRRGIAASSANASEVPVKIHDSRTTLTPAEADRFKIDNGTQAKRLGLERGTQPKTYGEAVEFRSAKQSPRIPSEGTPNTPSVRPTPLPSTSRANQVIGNISKNIQANSRVATANQWMVNNASKISKVGRVVGKGLIVVGIAVEVYNIGSAYEQDGGKIGANTKGAIGSAAGGLAGGLAGAKLGAMIGVIGGPVGIVVGGIIGGIVGGLIGAFAGKSIAGLFS